MEQRKGFKTPSLPLQLHPGLELQSGKRKLMTQSGPNESIKGGPNQIVKRTLEADVEDDNEPSKWQTTRSEAEVLTAIRR